MPYTGELSALVTALLWSLSSFAFATAAQRIGSLQLNVNRMIFGSMMLLLTIVIFDIQYILSYSQIVNLTISGIIGLIIGDSFLFKAYQNIGPRLSVLLLSLSPVMSAGLAYIFLGERISMWGVLGIFITIGGVALVVLEKNERPTSRYKIDKRGIFHGIMAALGQAAGLIFAKLAFDEGEINGFIATFVRVFTSTLIIIPMALLIRKYKNPIKLYMADTKALTATLTGTLFGPFLGITFSLIAVSNTKVGIAATLMSTMPVLMLPMVKYFYKESLTWRAIVGAIITVAGITILFLR